MRLHLRRKHSNALRPSQNWLKNLKCVWHEPKIHVLRFPHFGNFDPVICERLVGLVSFETNVSKTAGQIHEIDLVTGLIYHLIER